MAPTDRIPNPPTSPQPPETPPGSPAYTPPESIRVHVFPQSGSIDRFEHAVEKLVRALENVDTGNRPEAAKPEAIEHVAAEKRKTRASKLEYKLVDEVWDDSTSKYRIVNSVALPEEVTDLDEYIFVVRARTEKKTSEQVFYVDIKSDGLRDVLRVVLRDVHGLSLGEDKITLERNLLYHYILKLEAHQTGLEDDANNDAKVKHLNLLVEYIRTVYVSTTSRLISLLGNREITYDLLWALFKPNAKIYTTILDAEKPACYRYDSGKEKTTTTGLTYFHVECRLLDFNGQVFGEVSTALGIRKFQGAKRVDRLEAFPLEFHRHQKKMKDYLVRCGRRFVSLMGQHHVRYHGNAFYIEKGEYVEVPVDSRIMVDAAYFRKINPNYTRPHINELARPSSSNNICSLFFFDTESEEVKSNCLDTATMSEEDLMICSQTVYGWSFGNKRWLEFAVDDITDIVWNPSSFDNLAIPAAKKKVITALAKSHISPASDDVIDDFVQGKGQGLITLLHGPPGVGKTLTVEGLSEFLRRPLYAISAGELGQDAKTLEERLSTIFRLAHHWKAILLLDEADVFVQSRSFINPHNALVSVFLRTLEYYRGIMILTTNRVKDIDDAVQSRISVALHYGPLGLDTRKTIWESFLKKAATAKAGAKYTSVDLDWLAKKEVNGRQIKNMIATAHALAVSEMVPLSRSQLEVVIGLDEEFQKDYSGAGPMANKASAGRETYRRGKQDAVEEEVVQVNVDGGEAGSVGGKGSLKPEQPLLAMVQLGETCISKSSTKKMTSVESSFASYPKESQFQESDLGAQSDMIQPLDEWSINELTSATESLFVANLENDQLQQEFLNHSLRQMKGIILEIKELDISSKDMRSCL
ncbi:MAG: hypothetical protein M1812_005793 [Candelaria pacifica]|nr:MAG: hypothetical protein M1812_005793 [Candelaria pacifica]